MHNKMKKLSLLLLMLSASYVARSEAMCGCCMHSLDPYVKELSIVQRAKTIVHGISLMAQQTIMAKNINPERSQTYCRDAWLKACVHGYGCGLLLGAFVMPLYGGTAAFFHYFGGLMEPRELRFFSVGFTAGATTCLGAWVYAINKMRS